MGDNSGFNFLDALAIFSVILQLMQMQEDARQVGNGVLMDELQNQNSEYLSKILQNQELILEKLAKLG